MFALLKKEINSFLSSIVGYIVIITFLIITGLFLWVFPGEFNILNAGYATIDNLFILAPWIFMFLIPAVTMRLFADEQKSGTIELLFTRPISDVKLIAAKYLSGFILLCIAVIPTLSCFFTVYYLSTPVGNVDIGGTIGSYIGLLLLGSAFVAIGIFSSSLTENQVIAFIIGLFFSFFCYYGFEAISSMVFEGDMANIISKIGISNHYISLSRGVIDTRDVIYFCSINLVFLLFTSLKLGSRKW